MADLYQFTLTDGTVLQYTSFDQDIAGYSSALGWERTKWKLAVGLSVDTMDITLHAAPQNLSSNGMPVIEHIASGAWDGADVIVSRAYMATPADAPATVPIFEGWIGDITEIGRIRCKMQLQSKLALLNVGLPKALFQPSCRHVFGDSGCTINVPSLSVSGAVQAGSTQNVIQSGITSAAIAAAPTSPPALSSHSQSGVNLPSPATYFVVATYTTANGETVASPESSIALNAANLVIQVASPATVTGATGWNVYMGPSSGDGQLQNQVPLALGSAYNMAGGGIYLSGIKPPSGQTQGQFALGTITFTSGSNAGFSRSVSASTATGTIAPQIPLFESVAIGDTFQIVVGCDHTMAMCAGKFSNLIHFGGFPFIPPPELGSA